MRTFRLLLVFLTVSALGAHAQEPDAPEGTLIKSAQVSGLDLDDLSPGLRHDIDALVDQPLDWSRASDLADRIEAEHPDVVAAVRAIQTPDGEARVVYFVARINDDRSLAENINARYIVESVDIEGVPETAVSQDLRDQLKGLVGGRLDRDAAGRLIERLHAELPGYEIRQRVSRGSRRGRIRLTFLIREGEEMRWLHFTPSRSKFIYHSVQGWSGLLDIRFGGGDFRITPTFALSDDDDLVEEYSGFGLRVESRRLVSERVGAGLELSTFNETWQPVTLAAVALNPTIPEAYRNRSTIAPYAIFAFHPRVRASLGVSVNELESLTRSPASQMANVVAGAVDYDQRWRRGDSRHDLQAGFTVRASSDALASDLAYRRYFTGGSYRYRRDDGDVIVAGMAGRISGEAPLFERFTLGDSSTLRGWNKYDITPAGGDRMYYSSIEFRYHGAAFFIDAGSVWDRTIEQRLRFATGFGFHHENVFLTIGVPLNTDDVGAIFMMGVRF